MTRIKDNGLKLKDFSFMASPANIVVDEEVCLRDFCPDFATGQALFRTIVAVAPPDRPPQEGFKEFSPKSELFVTTEFQVSTPRDAVALLDAVQQEWSQIPGPASFVLLATDWRRWPPDARNEFRAPPRRSYR